LCDRWHHHRINRVAERIRWLAGIHEQVDGFQRALLRGIIETAPGRKHSLGSFR